MKSEFYVDIEGQYSVNVYRTDGEHWWVLVGWSSGDILFTKCKKPRVKLSLIQDVPTLLNPIRVVGD